MNNNRLDRQLEFILEIDKLKQVERQTLLTDGSRMENSAEHSWNVALMALVLSEYAADANIDFCRVVKMLLVHDLVEIDAGDTYCYDEKNGEGANPKGRKRPPTAFSPCFRKTRQRNIGRLWDEFEAKRDLRVPLRTTPSTACIHCCTIIGPRDGFGGRTRYGPGRSWPAPAT